MAVSQETTAVPSARPRLLRARRVFAPIAEARGLNRTMLWLGIAITAAFVLVAVFAPWIAPYDFDTFRANGERFVQLEPPSRDHIMGTNVQSTDVFSRIVWGTRTELQVVLVSLLISITVGVPLGLFSGYFGGKLDRVLTAAIAITVVYIPLYFRVVRNHTISIKEEPFVEAARALGARPLTIIRKYVFFNVVQNVPPLATLNAADAILTLAALGFLGYGIQPTEGAEWGYDVNRAVSDAASGIWWTGLFPGLAIVLLVVGLTLLGESLNETMNPVLRKRPKVDVDLEAPPPDPGA
jgi:peptide/nickel transport system permease protein